MFPYYRIGAFLAALAAFLLVSTPAAPQGLGGKLKKKVQAKVVDKTVDKAEKKLEGKEEAVPEAAGDTPIAASASETEVSKVSTKFDFVPGDRVVLYDDFTQDDLGEFPMNWRLVGGTFEVAEMGGERWLMCTSNDGHVRMKLPDMQALPEYWTLEFDFYCTEPMNSALTVSALGQRDQAAWWAVYPQGDDLAFTTGSIASRTTLEAPQVAGRHHIMFMARGTGIKAYIDRQRMASVPEISTDAGPPSAIEFRLWAKTKPMITNVRFAEGNKPTKDPFADGKLITYGIYFDSGSDVVKAESAPVLRQIAAYLEANAAVKVQIDGHTDNQGTPDGNLDLSKRRAAAVANVLSEQFAIAADRFGADGMGDTKPISDNAKAEGRAMNRRVEFTRL